MVQAVAWLARAERCFVALARLALVGVLLLFVPASVPHAHLEAGTAADQPEADPAATATPSASEDEHATSPPDARTVPTPTPTPEPAGPITVALAGDVHAEDPIGEVLAAGANPLDGVTPIFAGADVTIVNLETAVGTGGVPQDKAYTFQAHPALLAALAAAGVDGVNLANNHTLDYGIEGLRQTIALAEDAGLAVVGAGESAAEAYAPHLVEVRGATVAVVGLTHVIPEASWAATHDRPGLASAYDHDRAARAVAEAAEVADHVVVTVHWGEEGELCPNEDQRELAPALVAAGADVIAGHHPHRLQALTFPGDAAVGWSLGNFLWNPTSVAGRRTGVLLAEVSPDGGVAAEVAPVFIDDQGRPQPAERDHAGKIRRQLRELPETCGL